MPAEVLLLELQHVGCMFRGVPVRGVRAPGASRGTHARGVLAFGYLSSGVPAHGAVDRGVHACRAPIGSHARRFHARHARRFPAPGVSLRGAIAPDVLFRRAWDSC